MTFASKQRRLFVQKGFVTASHGRDRLRRHLHRRSPPPLPGCVCAVSCFFFVKMFACLVHLDTPHLSGSNPPKNPAQVSTLPARLARRGLRESRSHGRRGPGRRRCEVPCAGGAPRPDHRRLSQRGAGSHARALSPGEQSCKIFRIFTCASCTTASAIRAADGFG